MKNSLIMLPTLLLGLQACCASTTEQTLYTGTYGEAIHVLNYNPETGTLTEKDSIPARNASYLTLERDGDGVNTIYAVSEKGSSSGIYSFSKARDGWKQTAFLLETGADPCFILNMDGTGLVATADYSGGSFSVFNAKDGSIQGRVQHERFDSVYEGNPPSSRQSRAHIHQVREIPASILGKLGLQGRFLLVSDLGNDLIRIERLNSTSPFLEQVGTIPCGPGVGPRHMEFNERTLTLYCITELSGELIVWNISAGNTASEGQPASTGIPAFTEVRRARADGLDAGGSADIHLHPSGKWLYTSHRLQDDGISVFNVGADGIPEKSAYVRTGIHPRNFTFSPDGRRILVACRDSRSIEVYDLDMTTGQPSAKVHELILPADKPVCLVFE